MSDPIQSAHRLRILLLSHVRPGHAGTSHDHEHALAEFSRHNVFVHSPLEERVWFPPLDNFDVIILHYSIMIWSENYLPKIYVTALQNYRGLKILFIQDEYREIYNALDMMERIGVDLLFTCVPERSIESIYGALRRRGVRIEKTLTGYVPISFDQSVVRGMDERTLDVAYRAREVPFSLGKLGQEKINIAKGFKQRCALCGLREDINWTEESRIYGDAWYKFLASSRTSLGTESGSSICDFTGAIDRATKEYLAEKPSASFDEVERQILAPYEGNVIVNAISPRVFEAAFLRTVLILFPGEYSDLLQPGRHYIVLEKDFSNFDDVADQIRDVRHLETIANRTFCDLVETNNWSFPKFAQDVDRLVDEEWRRRVWRPKLVDPHYFGSPNREFASSINGKLLSIAPAELILRDDWRRGLAELRRRSSRSPRDSIGDAHATYAIGAVAKIGAVTSATATRALVAARPIVSATNKTLRRTLVAAVRCVKRPIEFSMRSRCNAHTSSNKR
jgi:hypothetical protein